MAVAHAFLRLVYMLSIWLSVYAVWEDDATQLFRILDPAPPEVEPKLCLHFLQWWVPVHRLSQNYALAASARKPRCSQGYVFAYIRLGS